VDDRPKGVDSADIARLRDQSEQVAQSSARPTYPNVKMQAGNLEGCLLTGFWLQNHPKKKKPRRLLPASGLPSFDFSANP
jgi:hypothetical protein